MGCQNSKPEVIDEPSGTTKAGKANTRVDATDAAVKPVPGPPGRTNSSVPATHSPVSCVPAQVGVAAPSPKEEVAAPLPKEEPAVVMETVAEEKEALQQMA